MHACSLCMYSYSMHVPLCNGAWTTTITSATLPVANMGSQVVKAHVKRGRRGGLMKLVMMLFVCGCVLLSTEMRLTQFTLSRQNVTAIALHWKVVERLGREADRASSLALSVANIKAGRKPWFYVGKDEGFMQVDYPIKEHALLAQDRMERQLRAHFAYQRTMPFPRTIWQTWRDNVGLHDDEQLRRSWASTWLRKNDGFEYELVTN